ncbi:M15 family metallopeptidase [Microlunatus parietis]|uniref:D-alanyl-D-alanine dipeptidase n=1 Tax=Microlunatus parietis TaxID=682979 RepID=A0A7Y9ICE2_9ACTN|nr:M15 family metallopeptidase [Microlunatus parietis]NYE74336.1 D-alanyl-D-alanine dipeptidase [Microlunatus parietis]
MDQSVRTATVEAVLGEADGVIPDGTSVSVYADVPAVNGLDPALLKALRRAARAAALHGIGLRINGGWRSPARQLRLLENAIERLGSEEAARWVATPETSAHVAGQAVDVGPVQAAAWLSEHGARYGLCRVYRNEPWHFELCPEAARYGNPPLYANPSEDPRHRTVHTSPIATGP